MVRELLRGLARSGLIALMPVAVATGGFLLASAVGARDFEEAAPGENTILLSDSRVQHPYRDPVTGEVDAGQVGVAFDQDWSSSTFPGETDCEIKVLDPAGEVLGVTIVQVGSLVTHVEAGEPNLPIDIRGGSPAGASATCAAGKPPAADGGYRFSDLSVEQNENGGVHLWADVTWTTGVEPPGTAACTARLTRADGEPASLDFTLSYPEGRAPILLLGERDLGASVESVSCQPFTG